MGIYEFTGYQMPDGVIQTTDEELKVAGRSPENLKALKDKSLGAVALGDGVEALALSKTKPYTPSPYDNMLLVTEMGGLVKDVTQIEVGQLEKLLRVATKIEEEYMRERAGGMLMGVVSYNFHEAPLPKEVFGVKLSAQSVESLHVHVMGFSTDDFKGVREVRREDLPHSEWVESRDPMSNLVEKLMAFEPIGDKLIEGCVLLKRTVDDSLEGISFVVERKSGQSAEMAHDLQRIHNNFIEIYHEIVGLLVDERQVDSVGMPMVRERDMRAKMIEEYFNQYDGDELKRKELKRWLVRIGEVLKNSESELDRKRPEVFLRGPAYTMSIVSRRKGEDLVVNFSPRLLSTGNFLTTLGMRKRLGEKPDALWWAKKEEADKGVRRVMADTNI